MDNKTKLRIGGLALLTTAVLSLIIVLIVDSWPLAILLAVIIVAADGEPAFNTRLNYCADCTQAKSLEMQGKGRCNPYHLSPDPEPVPAGGWQARDEAVTQRTKTQQAQDLPVSSAMRWQDAFERLVTHLLALGARAA